MKTIVYTPDGTRKAMLYKTGLTIHGEDFMVEKQKRLYVFYVRDTFVSSRGKREASLDHWIRRFEMMINSKLMPLTKEFVDNWIKTMREESDRIDNLKKETDENKTQAT